jgi:hypothetical protein
VYTHFWCVHSCYTPFTYVSSWFGHPDNILWSIPLCKWSRDTSVGIATRYGLVGPGIESRWERDVRHLSIPAVRPTQPPIQWVPGRSPR